MADVYFDYLFDDPAWESEQTRKVAERQQAEAVLDSQVTFDQAVRAADIARAYPQLDGGVVATAAFAGLDHQTPQLIEIAYRQSVADQKSWWQKFGPTRIGAAAVRQAFLAFEGMVDEVWDRPLRTYTRVTQYGEDPYSAWLKAGPSAFARQFGQIASGQPVNVGSGILGAPTDPYTTTDYLQDLVDGYTPDVAANRALQRTGIPLTTHARDIQNQTIYTQPRTGWQTPVSLGRMVAVQAVEPGTAPFHYLSGGVDFAKQLWLDPAGLGLAKLADVRQARRMLITSRLNNATDAGARMPARLRTHAQTVAEWKQREEAVYFRQWLAHNRSMSAVDAALPGLDVRQKAALVHAETIDDVDEILDGLLGLTIRRDPISSSVVGRAAAKGAVRGARVIAPKSALADEVSMELANIKGFGATVKWGTQNNPLGRMFTDLHAVKLNVEDVNEAYQNASDFMIQAKYTRAQRDTFLYRLATEVESGDFAAMYSWASDMMRPYRARLLSMGWSEPAVNKFTELFSSDMSIRMYMHDSAGRPVQGLPGSPKIQLEDGTVVDLPQAVDESEFAMRWIKMPDPYGVLRVNSRIRRATDVGRKMVKMSPKYADESLGVAWLDAYQTYLFKPLVLLRPAWTVRVVGEELLRMSASGLDSIYSHPLSYLAWTLGDRLGSLGKGQTGLLKLMTTSEFEKLRDTAEWADSMSEMRKRLLANHGLKPGKEATRIWGITSRTQDWDAWRNGVAREYLQAYQSRIMRKIAEIGADNTLAWLQHTEEGRKVLDDIARRAGAGNPLRQLADDPQMVRWHVQQLNARVHQLTGGTWVRKTDDGRYINNFGREVPKPAGMADDDIFWITQTGKDDLIGVIATGKVGNVQMSPDMKIRRWKQFVAELTDTHAADLPEVVKAPKYSNVPNHLRSSYDQFTTYMFSMFGERPTNFLSRNPAFLQLYWNEVGRMALFSTRDVRLRVFEAARAANVERELIRAMRKEARLAGVKIGRRTFDELLDEAGGLPAGKLSRDEWLGGGGPEEPGGGPSGGALPPPVGPKGGLPPGGTTALDPPVIEPGGVIVPSQRRFRPLPDSEYDKVDEAIDYLYDALYLDEIGTPEELVQFLETHPAAREILDNPAIADRLWVSRLDSLPLDHPLVDRLLGTFGGRVPEGFYYLQHGIDVTDIDRVADIEREGFKIGGLTWSSERSVSYAHANGVILYFPAENARHVVDPDDVFEIGKPWPAGEPLPVIEKKMGGYRYTSVGPPDAERIAVSEELLRDAYERGAMANGPSRALAQEEGDEFFSRLEENLQEWLVDGIADMGRPVLVVPSEQLRQLQMRWMRARQATSVNPETVRVYFTDLGENYARASTKVGSGTLRTRVDTLDDVFLNTRNDMLEAMFGRLEWRGGKPARWRMERLVKDRWKTLHPDRLDEAGEPLARHANTFQREVDAAFADDIKAALGIDIRTLSAAGWREFEEALAMARYNKPELLARKMGLPSDPAAWDARFKPVPAQYRYRDGDVLLVPRTWLKKFGDQAVVDDFRAMSADGWAEMGSPRDVWSLYRANPSNARAVEDLRRGTGYFTRGVQQFGIEEPLILSQRSGNWYLADGHHRLLAAEDSGMDMVPVRINLDGGADPDGLLNNLRANTEEIRVQRPRTAHPNQWTDDTTVWQKPDGSIEVFDSAREAKLFQRLHSKVELNELDAPEIRRRWRSKAVEPGLDVDGNVTWSEVPITMQDLQVALQDAIEQLAKLPSPAPIRSLLEEIEKETALDHVMTLIGGPDRKLTNRQIRELLQTIPDARPAPAGIYRASADVASGREVRLSAADVRQYLETYGPKGIGGGSGQLVSGRTHYLEYDNVPDIKIHVETQFGSETPNFYYVTVDGEYAGRVMQIGGNRDPDKRWVAAAWDSPMPRPAGPPPRTTGTYDNPVDAQAELVALLKERHSGKSLRPLPDTSEVVERVTPAGFDNLSLDDMETMIREIKKHLYQKAGRVRSAFNPKYVDTEFETLNKIELAHLRAEARASNVYAPPPPRKADAVGERFAEPQVDMAGLIPSMEVEMAETLNKILLGEEHIELFIIDPAWSGIGRDLFDHYADSYGWGRYPLDDGRILYLHPDYVPTAGDMSRIDDLADEITSDVVRYETGPEESVTAEAWVTDRPRRRRPTTPPGGGKPPPPPTGAAGRFFDSLPEGEIDDLEMIDEIAKQAAMNGVKNLLYDLSRKHAWAASTRLVFPFGEAWQEILTRWAQMVAEKPQILRRAQQGLVSAREEGWFYEDDYGNEVFNFPGQRFLGHILDSPWLTAGLGLAAGGVGGALAAGGLRSVATGVGALGGGAAAAKFASNPGAQAAGQMLQEGNLNLTGNVQGLNLVAGGFLPGFGPIVQTPAAWWMPKSMLYGRMYDILFPFGKPEYKSIGGWVDAAVPAWMKKFIAASDEGDGPFRVQFANTVMDVYSMLIYRGDVQPASGPEDFQAGVNRAKEIAQSLYVIRGLGQALGPVGPQPHGVLPVYDQTELDNPNPETITLRALADEWNRYLQAYQGDGVMALHHFTRAFGINPLAVRSKTFKVRERSVQREGQRQELFNPDLFEEGKFPNTAYYGWPDKLGPDEFLWEAYQRQRETGIRVPKTPEQYALDVGRALGEMYMEQRKLQVEGRTDDAAVEWLRAHSVWAATHYWGFGQTSDGSVVGQPASPSLTDKVLEFYEWQTEPRLSQTDAGQGLAMFLPYWHAAEDQAMGRGLSPVRPGSASNWTTSTQVGHLSDWLAQKASDVIAQHPDFRYIWTSTFKPMLDATDVTQPTGLSQIPYTSQPSLSPPRSSNG